MITKADLEELFYENLETNIKDPDEDGPRVYYKYQGKGESHAGFAVVCSRQFFAQLLMELGVFFRYKMDDENEYLDPTPWENWKQDGFGKSDVIFYWPDVQIDTD